MNTRLWIALIFTVCAALFTWWAMENFYLEEVRLPGRPKGEALTNPFFATQKLLEELGAKVESRDGYGGPPKGAAQGSVMFMPSNRRALSKTQEDDLLTWVRAGGHLIVMADNRRPGGVGTARPDAVMDAVGVSVKFRKDKRLNKARNEDGPKPANPQDGDTLPDEDPVGDESGDEDKGLARMFPDLQLAINKDDCLLHRETGEQPPRFPAQWMRLCVSPSVALVSTRDPLWAATATGGDHVVTHALGKGQVSVLTTNAILKSHSIHHADHADFLVALLGGKVQGLRLLIIAREDVDNLAVLAWRHGPAVVISLALLLVLWLWSTVISLGPVVVPALPVRRSIQEHVQALGEFWWRERTPDLLWKATLECTRKDIARKVPRFTSDAALASYLARRTGLPEADLQFAFNPDSVTEAQAFVRAIATLEYLRKSL